MILKSYFINSFIHQLGTLDPAKMDPSKCISAKHTLHQSRGPHTPLAASPQAPILRATRVGFVIYNTRPTNKFYYSNMWSRSKEKSTLIFRSEATFSALFTHFSLFNHRGTVSKNYYVKQYIKKWVLVFFAINNHLHLFWEHKCSPELLNIVCSQECRPIRNGTDLFPRNSGHNPAPQLCDRYSLCSSPCSVDATMAEAPAWPSAHAK